MADEDKDPAEVIGDNVADTVSAVQQDAASAVEAAEQRAIDAAQTAEHIAAAARESAIAHDVGEKHREIDEWRQGLESRFSNLESTVATLPQQLQETVSTHLTGMREDLDRLMNPPQSTPPQPSATDPAMVESRTDGDGTAGPRESPAADPPAPPKKRRHVL